MRNKFKVLDCFKVDWAELAYYGYRVEHLDFDRGGEYFSQQGELTAGKKRSSRELDNFCARLSPKIKHLLIPVESKEEIAEVCFGKCLKQPGLCCLKHACLPHFGVVLCVILNTAITACQTIVLARRRLIKSLLERGLVGAKIVYLDVMLIG